MKKILVLVVVTALVIASLAGCSQPASTQAAQSAVATVASTQPATAPSTQATKAANYKVYLITMDQMDQHWVHVDGGCQKAVKELGNVDYKWLAPDVKDDAKQIECINNAIAGGANAILVAANGPDAVTDTLKEATAKGITLVYVDSPANYDAAVQTLATDNQAAGKVAGQEMLKALTAKGITEGKIGVISVNAATNSTVKRDAGFRSAFDGTKFELLQTQYSNGDAAASKDIATNYITQGCVGIFGTNEGCTVGTGNAIKENSSKIIGVGFDKSDMILSLIKDGYLLCAMAQNPETMGYEGMKTAVAALEGTLPTQKNIDTGVTVINASNVDSVK